MPLQNRVTPFGKIIATPARGAWTGNRGVIHRNKQIIRSFKTQYWITCTLHYKDFRRQVMTENRWTELFFLDEATAFAAGHRPCAFCRNSDFKRFKAAWITANAITHPLLNEKITTIDAILHVERITPTGEKVTYTDTIKNLPNGTMITMYDPSKSYLLHKENLWEWSPAGYIATQPAQKEMQVKVLTPKSIVETFRQGYLPQTHNSISLS